MEAKDISEGAELHGTYRLRELLGQGGMGAVWEAEHMRLPRRIAIKFLVGPGRADPELVARFRREAEIASRLVHPHIVSVHDYNVLEDGTPYLVMDRLEGEDLRARLCRGALSYEEARTTVLQIASALDLAHGEGVVHRDLKPENVFLCPSPDGGSVAKVLDFGISKIESAAVMMTREDVVLGTPGYMAPEQAMGKNAAVDRRTDLFSLAAIFYEMVTGENVFLGETLAEVVYKVTQFVPEPLSQRAPTVPPSVSNAVAVALSKEQGMRQPSVSAFAAAFLGEALPAGAQRAPTPDPGMSSTVLVSSSSRAPGPSENERSVSQEATSSPQWSTDTRHAEKSESLGPSPATTAPSVYRREISGRTESLLSKQDRQAFPESREGTVSRGVPSKMKWSGLVIGTLLVAAGGAAGLMVGRPSEPTAEDSASDLSTAVEQTEQGAPVHPLVSSESQPLGSTDSTVPAQEGGKDPVAPIPKTQPHPLPAAAAPSVADPSLSPSPKAETVSSQATEKEVSPLLSDASSALAQGDHGRALRLARNSLRDKKSSQAYVIMAKAYCGKRDIGMARAMQRNLGPGGKKSVAIYCAELGIELAP